MSETLTVTEIARHFADYLNRVVYRRESFVLMRGNRAIAELRPLPSGKRLSDLPRMVASLPHLTEEEADSFGQDIEAARDELAQAQVRDVWES